MCDLLPDSVAQPKSVFGCSLQRGRFSCDKPIEVKEVLATMHTELEDEQIKFITDSIVEFLK